MVWFLVQMTAKEGSKPVPAFPLPLWKTPRLRGVNLSHLFLIGLPADNDLSFVREFDPSGVILMGRNARPATEIRALSNELRGKIICTDHEGGRVQRLKDGFEILPSAREVAQGGEENVFETAKRVASELSEAGINLNFAPVCDVPTHEGDTVIGTRAFASSFQVASEMVAAYVSGLQEKVGACAKHFPGHGGVGLDSHLALPTFEGTREDLRAHLLPFRVAIGAGVGAIMVGHIAVPCVDESGAPASLSGPIIQGLLREELRFKGLIISDDLEMGALSSLGAGEVAVRALEAGCDLLLFCHRPDKALEAREAVEIALADGRLSREKLSLCPEKLSAWKARFVA